MLVVSDDGTVVGRESDVVTRKFAALMVMTVVVVVVILGDDGVVLGMAITSNLSNIALI